MSDPFHDRIADWLYGAETDDHRQLLDDIDRDRTAVVLMDEHCTWHGPWQSVALDHNAECPQCAAAHERWRRADAAFDAHDYRPGNSTTNNY